MKLVLNFEFLQYYCMVSFVRPNFLSNRTEFRAMYERPIKNGQCLDSTESDIRLMRHRSHLLVEKLKGFVQRRGPAILSRVLPPKREFVLFMKKSKVQLDLYRRFVEDIYQQANEEEMKINALKVFAVCCKIWNHPDILYRALVAGNSVAKIPVVAGNSVAETGQNFFLEEAETGQNFFSEEAEMGWNCLGKAEMGPNFFLGEAEDDLEIDGQQEKLNIKEQICALRTDWAHEPLANFQPGILENGLKFQFAFEIIDRSVLIGDKILLFSQSLFTLDLLEEYLKQRKIPTENCNWHKNRSYVRLDGKTNAMERERLIARFQNEPQVLLFLISTRAGCLGINLTAANRVIVFDASWNPCHDAQSVCRIYRYGQQKECFIYRLL